MTLHSQSKNIKGFEEAHDDDHRTVFPEPTLEDDTTSREVEHDSDVIIDREEPSILSHHLDSPNHQHTTSVEFSPVSPTLMSISTAKARNR